MEDKALIQCVVLFYEKGKCKLDYIRKEKFRASIECVQFKNTKEYDMVVQMFGYISFK